MDDLTTLARLVNWAKSQEACGFHLYTVVEFQENIKEAGVTRQWQTDIMFPTSDLIGPQAQTIDGACHNLIQVCHQQGIEIPKIVNPETIIPHHQDVTIRITNLYKMLPKFEKDHLSLLFQYMVGPKFPEGDRWYGSIYYDTRWSSYSEADVSGDTLHEICIKLWEEGVKKLEE